MLRAVVALREMQELLVHKAILVIVGHQELMVKRVQPVTEV
jgi:hypothetical protein